MEPSGHAVPVGTPDDRPHHSRLVRCAVAAAIVGGLVLMGSVGAVHGASQGDTLDVLKGGIIGALAGALLSLPLSCAALTRRLGILKSRRDLSESGIPCRS